MRQIVLVRDYGARPQGWRRVIPLPKRAFEGKERAFFTGIPVERRLGDPATEVDDYKLDEGAYRRLDEAAYAEAHRAVGELTPTLTQGWELPIALEAITWELYYCLSGAMHTIEHLSIALHEPGSGAITATGDRRWNEAITRLADDYASVRTKHLMRFDIARALDPLLVRRQTATRVFGAPTERSVPITVEPRGDRSRALFLITGASSARSADAIISGDEFGRAFGDYILLGPTSVRAHLAATDRFLSLRDLFEKDRVRALPTSLRSRLLQRMITNPSVARGVRLSPLVVPWLRFLIHARLALVVGLARVADRFLRQQSPDVLIACGFDEDWRICTFIRAAQRLGIPTVSVQDGDFTSMAGVQTRADKICVQGFETKDYLKRQGTPEDRIEVTGQPRYDFLAGGDQSDRRTEARRTLSIAPTTRLAVFATDPGTGWGSTAYKLTAERGVLEEFRLLGDWDLILKLHPSESGSATTDLLRGVDNPAVRIERNVDVHDLLDACNVWICMYSTTALEAVLHGRPVIITNFNGENALKHLVEAGIAWYLEHPGQLPRLMSTIQEIEHSGRMAESRRRFLADQIAPVDGRASDRVAAVARISAVARQRVLPA